MYILPKDTKRVLNASTSPTSKITPTSFSKNTQLDEVVSSELDGTKGTYGIVVKDLATGESYSRNPQKSFESASLYKLWIMAVVFEKVEKGDLELNTVLSQDVKVLNEKFKIASESAERSEGKITLSVENALFNMITFSDNYAALLLTEKIRLSSVTTFLDEQGFEDSKVGTSGKNPTTTSSDMALFLERLYRGDLVSESASKEMLELLKQQRLNNKLPLNLPDSTVVAHKTGELGDFTHDAGIVYTTSPYIIVAMSESSDPLAAEGRIADVSLAVYKYFTVEK